MNAHLFRLVFSKKQGTLVPVAEFVNDAGKCADGATTSAASGVILRLRKLWLALALSLGLLGGALSPVQAATALPTGGTVVTGSGSLSQSGNTLTVQQNSKNLGVNWQTFDIAKDHAVVFNQPSVDSVALNRVIGGTRSEIYGSLQANGQVFLLNPNGILFGRTAEVNVGGLLATTKAISDADFAAGNYKFTSSGGNGAVINQGNLRARDGGIIALAADQVTNEGSIWANEGRVDLAAGGSFSLQLDAQGLTKVNVDSSTLNAMVENKGLIVADGGAVGLTAHGREMLQANVMNLEGIVQTRSRNGKSGTIALDAGKSGTVTMDDAVFDLTGLNAGERGGTLTATGQNIRMTGATTIDARGYAGGGTVNIGGGFQGSGQLAHAATLYVGENVRTDVSATQAGNAGQAVFWSDDFTEFHGAVKARGGEVSGHGGLVEVSGKQNLLYRPAEQTDTRASHGQWGTLYLDPANISITHGAAGGNNATAVNGAAGDSSITDGQLIAELSTTGVALTATNTISDATDVNVTTTGGGALTLNAANIDLQGDYSVNGGLIFNVGNSGITKGLISGAGGVTKQGAGRLVIAAPNRATSQLYNNNWWTGNTSIEAGTLEFRNVARLRTPNMDIASGAVVEVNYSATTPLLDAGDSAGLNDPGLSQARWMNITGGGTFRKVGDGIYYMALNSGTNQVIFNMDAGALVDVQEGSLVEMYAAAGNQADLRVAANAYAGMNNDNNSPPDHNSTFGGLFGAGTIGISAKNNPNTSPVTLIIGNGDRSGNFTGVITRTPLPGSQDLTGSTAMSLAKIGTGSQILSGNNDYSGTTLVSCGTLQVGNNGTSGTLGQGAVTTNASLVFNRSDTVSLSTMASCTSAISGTGNLKALIGGGFTVDRSIDLSGGASEIWLEAGKNHLAGDATGGDVSYGNGATLRTTAGGRIVVFSGNPAANTLDAGVSGATGGDRYKTYNASEASLASAVAGTRNYYFRAQPNLTVNGTISATKTYDGTNNVLAGSLNTSGVTTQGYVDGDSGAGNLSLNTSGVTYNTSHAGTHLNLTGVTVNGTTAWRYYNGTTAVYWNVSGYGLKDDTAKDGTITPRDLTVKLNDVSKTFDGTTVAYAAGGTAQPNTTANNGLVGGQNLTDVTGNGTYNSAHVVGATNASFNASNLNYSFNGGALSSDYNITLVNPTNASITARDLTIQLNNISKTYDGTSAAQANGGVAQPNTTVNNGLVAGDSLSNVTGTGRYNDAHVLNASSANFAAANLTSTFANNDASDYNISYQNPVSAVILKKTVSVTGNVTAQDKTYDGTTNATVNASGLGLTGMVGNETLSVNQSQTYGQFDSADAGNRNITLNMSQAIGDGTGANAGLASDYNITNVPTAVSANITARDVYVNLSTAAEKTYDGTTANVGTMTQHWQAQNDTLAQGLIGNQALAFNFTATYQDKHANGTVGIDLSNVSIGNGANGGLAGNYHVIYQGVNATTTPLSGANAATAIANASAGAIVQRVLTVVANQSSKTYDGNTYAQNETHISNGSFVTGEGANFTTAFTDANVGAANKTVNITGAEVNAATRLSDYNITYVANTTSTISARTVHVNLAQAADRVYDGTTTHVGPMTQNWQAQNNTAAQGLVGNQSLAFTYNASYASKDADTAVAINLANVSIGDGSNGGLATNYNVIYDTPDGTTQTINNPASPVLAIANASSGTITRAPLRVTAQYDSRIYDGTTSSTRTPTCSGAVAGESCQGLAQSFASPGPGNILINPARLTGIGNGLLDNYDISYESTPGLIRSASIDDVIFVALAPPDRNRPQRGIEETTTRSADQDRIVVTQSPESVLLASAHAYGDVDRAAELLTVRINPDGTLTSTSAQNRQGTMSSNSARDELDVPTAEQRYALPASGVLCVQGAIRVPNGVSAYPVQGCTVGVASSF